MSDLCCGRSANEIYDVFEKPQAIELYHRTICGADLLEFFQYFQEITFRNCIFERTEEKSSQNFTSMGQKIQTEMITIKGIHCTNVINLITQMNLLKGAKFKLLKFDDVLYYFEPNDLCATTAISDVPLDFFVDEISVKFVDSKREIAFWLILVEKFIQKLQRFTLSFKNSFDLSYLDELIREDDKRLEAIDGHVEENFLIET